MFNWLSGECNEKGQPTSTYIPSFSTYLNINKRNIINFENIDLKRGKILDCDKCRAGVCLPNARHPAPVLCLLLCFGTRVCSRWTIAEALARVYEPGTGGRTGRTTVAPPCSSQLVSDHNGNNIRKYSLCYYSYAPSIVNVRQIAPGSKFAIF